MLKRNSSCLLHAPTENEPTNCILSEPTQPEPPAPPAPPAPPVPPEKIPLYDRSLTLFAPPVPPSVATEATLPRETGPRVDPYLNEKIRSLCLVLVGMVVFNHSTNTTLGYHDSFSTFVSTGAMDAQRAPILSFIEAFISDSLGRITVPFFFFVSGYLFFFGWQPSGKSYLGKLRRRVFTLLIPYLVWSLIGMIGYYVIHLITNLESIVANLQAGNYDVGYVLRLFLRAEMPYHLWFMRDLMVIMLVSPLWAWIIRKAGYAALVAVLIFYFFKVQAPLVDQRGLCLFLAGAFFGFRMHDLKLPGRKCQFTLLFLWIAVAALYAGLSLWTEMNLRVLLRALNILGLFGAWAGFDLLSDAARRWLKGKAHLRFFIYVSHEPLLTGLQAAVYPWLPQNQPAYLAAFLIIPPIIILSCTAAASVIRGRSERVYYFLSGGR